MTDTARSESDTKEFFDDAETLNAKIKKLAELVQKSEHFVAFTGAGISTAAGIADFRSGINTVLDTGAGKWAKNAAIKEGKGDQIKKPKSTKNSFKALPTKAHMALVGLMTQSPHYLKYLISQNTDGLHRRSGIPIDQMSELHGNRTLEVCKKCNRGYMRDFRCRGSARKQTVHDHFTGRYCSVPKCKGKLYDTIINFKENLPEVPLERAEENSAKSDLMLSLGSSLTVSPACDMPRLVGDKWFKENKSKKEPKHNLCIVNLQKTPLDKICSLRIYAKIDDVMLGLMKELNIEIPEWKLNRFVKVKLLRFDNRNDIRKLLVSGVDIDGIPASVFTKVGLKNNGKKLLHLTSYGNDKERPDEYTFSVPTKLDLDENDNEKKDNEEPKKGLVLNLAFYEHYQEPNLMINLNEYLDELVENDGQIVLRLVFDLVSRQWIVAKKEQQKKDKDIGKLWEIFKEENEEEKEQKNENDANE